MVAESGEAKRTKRSRFGFLLVLLLVLVTISVLLHLEKSRFQNEIDLGKDKLAARVHSRPIEATMDRRARFYQIQYFLRYPLAVSFTAADLARRIVVATAPMRLLAVQIDPGVHELSFKLTIEAAGHGEAQPRLAVVLERLRNIPGVIMADLFGPGPGTRGSRAPVHAIVGRAELQP